MALGKDYAGQDCALARALELVGERWTLLIVRDAFYGVRRYSDFHSHLGMPRAVLAERLQTLTDAGVLTKHRYRDAPPRDEYVLTDTGVRLWPALHALSIWGDQLAPTAAGPRRIYRHAACETRIDATGGCPKCGPAMAPTDIDVCPGPGSAPDPTERVSKALLTPHRLLEPLEVSRQPVTS